MALQDGKVVPGDFFRPPPASLWNAILDVGRWWLDQRKLGASLPPFVHPTDLIKLKNGTGGNLAAGRVVEIGAKLITTPTREHLWFTGGTPAPDGTKGIAISIRAMPNTFIDWCQVAGVAFCRLNVNHVQQTRADVDSSSTLLQSKWHGRCEILWKATASTGEQDAMVRIGEMFRGPINIVATSGITAGSSASCAVWWAGAAASPSSTITVHLNWMDGGNNIAAGAEAQCFWHPDQQKYVVSNTEC